MCLGRPWGIGSEIGVDVLLDQTGDVCAKEVVDLNPALLALDTVVDNTDPRTDDPGLATKEDVLARGVKVVFVPYRSYIVLTSIPESLHVSDSAAIKPIHVNTTHTIFTSQQKPLLFCCSRKHERDMHRNGLPLTTESTQALFRHTQLKLPAIQSLRSELAKSMMVDWKHEDCVCQG